MISLMVVVILTTYTTFANGECLECSIPTLLYDDLQCKPKYSNSNQCCPIEYDCSNIYNRPKGTCYFNGKYYKPGERPNKEDYASYCEHLSCECNEEGIFQCLVASDSCGEFWSPDFVKPGCYLTYEQNRCCSSGQKCAPFDENAVKCEIEGKIYREGEKFEHPKEKCTKCVCDKGLDHKLDKPFCQKYNCTSELIWSSHIDDYCAPAYLRWEDCCPRRWICSSENGTYSLPATLPPVNAPKCKFGEKTMVIGEKYKFQRQECECVIPPFLTCKY